MQKTPKTILLADDDLDDQELLQEAILKVEPEAHILTVSSGQEAFDYLQKCDTVELPCLIVLDYNMPHLSGPQVLEELNKLGKAQSIPKVIWSTSDAQQYRQVSTQKGAVAYFHKPMDFDGMLVLAKRMLSICGNA